MADSRASVLPKPAELRSELEGLGEKLNDLRQRDRNDEGVRAEIQDAIRQINETDVLYSTALRLDEDAAPQGGPAGATRQVDDGRDYRSAGEIFTSDDEYRSWAEAGRGGGFEREVRTLVTEATTGAVQAGQFLTVGQRVLPPQNIIRQRLFLRDALTVVPTSLASVPYIRELNSDINTSGATTVAEGNTKPESQIQFTPYDAPIRKIASWIPATYEILQDAPTLRGYIDSRLEYTLSLAEEKQLLNGDGNAPNIAGLLGASGLQTNSGADIPVNVGVGIGKVEAADGLADFVVMHPTNYWSMVTARSTPQFDGAAFTGNAPFGTPQRQLWGLPVVTSRGIATGHALVGSSIGAVVLDREQTVIRVGDQHSTYFVENKVAILAEKRVGMAIHRPDWFCYCTLA